MTVYELKRLLEDFDDDAEVRLAHQPSWPFEYSLADVIAIDPDDEAELAHQAIDDDEDECATVVYLVEGDQLGYLPGHAAAEIGWK
jgi:basic membrane lipoprotein Med (substrate-binding protein (PBP1-ABC) superfamily)